MELIVALIIVVVVLFLCYLIGNYIFSNFSNTTCIKEAEPLDEKKHPKRWKKAQEKAKEIDEQIKLRNERLRDLAKKSKPKKLTVSLSFFDGSSEECDITFEPKLYTQPHLRSYLDRFEKYEYMRFVSERSLNLDLAEDLVSRKISELKDQLSGKYYISVGDKHFVCNHIKSIEFRVTDIEGEVE